MCRELFEKFPAATHGSCSQTAMPSHIPEGLAPAARPEAARPVPVPEPGSSCAETLRALYVLLYHCSVAHQPEGADQADECSESCDRAPLARD